MRKQPDPEVLHHSCAALDGRDERLLQWITDSGLAAIAADNYAVEAFPAQGGDACCAALPLHRSEEHTSELQSLMRISYAVFCLKKKTLDKEELADKSSYSYR